MSLPAPTPPQKGVFTQHNKYRFQLSIYIYIYIYICEKPASLAYQEKTQLQEKSIIA